MADIAKELDKVNAKNVQEFGGGRDHVSYYYCTNAADLRALTNIKHQRVVRIAQDEAGLSKSGQTNLFTDGFLNCLCMVVTPAGQTEGGLVFHTHEIASGDCKDKNKLVSTVDILAYLSSRVPPGWGEYDITLLMGLAQAENMLTLPDLVPKIRESQSRLFPRMRNLEDLRHLRIGMDQIILDTDKKEIYIAGDNMIDVETELLTEVLRGQEDRRKEAGKPATRDEPGTGKRQTWKFIKDVAWRYGEGIFVDSCVRVWAFYEYP